MAIIISSKTIAAVAKWASADSSRPDLEFVVFRNDECIATDGHRAVIVKCETNGLAFGVKRSYLLAAAEAQEALRVRPATLNLSSDGTEVVIALGERASLRVPAGDISRYPDVHAIVPTPRANQPSPEGHCFNERYLIAIGEVHRAMGGDDNNGLQCVAWEAGRLGPTRWENKLGATFVIMPMRA